MTFHGVARTSLGSVFSASATAVWVVTRATGSGMAQIYPLPGRVMKAVARKPRSAKAWADRERLCERRSGGSVLIRVWWLTPRNAETDHLAGLELDQHVHVAVRTEVIPQHGTKQRQLPDVMTPAERGDPLSVDGDSWAHRRSAS